MYPITSASLLSEEFLSVWQNRVPKYKGTMCEPVLERTYLRYREDVNKRETWAEAVQRVVEYVFSLYSGPETPENLRPIAEKMYRKIFNFKLLPAGRTLWVGGSEASKKCGEANFNCFRRDTKFLTPHGYLSFEDFSDGDKVTVLSRYGGWKEATVKNFGVSRLMKLELRRGKRLKTIYTTADHRWVIKDNSNTHHIKEKTTNSLAVGDVIPTARRYQGQSDSRRIQPCPIAVQHGLVFGDGTLEKRTGSCRIDLCGDSRELVEHLTAGHRVGGDDREYEGKVVIDSLPWNWKQLPPLSANPEYLLGFLMGWFAADGGCGSNAVLSSKSESNLEWAKNALALLGIYSGEVRQVRDTSPFNGEPSALFGLNIYKQFITEEFMLKSKHREAFQCTNGYDWKVSKVEPTDIEEEVWCVQEPEQECFVLEDGILTRNCSFVAVDNLSVFSEIFQLLLCGCGVGFSVEKQYIEKLPELTGGKQVFHVGMDKHKSTVSRLEDTKIRWSHNLVTITIGDSKEAWAKALDAFLHMYRYSDVNITLDYSNIRPKGDRLKTFGGFAPGPEGLKKMFESLNDLLDSLKDEKITSTQAMDIANIVAKNVVIGGNRRSSEIALSDSNDIAFIEAKSPENFAANPHRIMSNNTIVFTSKPSKEELREVFERIKYNGEPGFFNKQAADLRRPNVKGINPCAEILLDSRGFCNLSTVVIPSHIKDGVLDIEDLLDSVRVASRIGLCITNVDVSLPEWDKIQKRDRLTGVSMTGYMDAMDILGWNFDSPESIDMLRSMRQAANEEATNLAYEMRIPRPLLVTAVKPEGTISNLPTVSSGIHRAYAPFYIRRVRYSDTDPVAKALEILGMKPIPDPQKPERLIFEFPVKSSTKIASEEESAISQYRRYLTFMRHYVDHNASCTLTFDTEKEIDEIVDAVFENWEDTVAVAWLPKYIAKADEKPYPYMPYEAITEEEYNDRMVVHPNLTDLHNLVDQIESGSYEYELDESDCQGGACPIR